jgi:hypothetical protein
MTLSLTVVSLADDLKKCTLYNELARILVSDSRQNISFFRKKKFDLINPEKGILERVDAHLCSPTSPLMDNRWSSAGLHQTV